MLHLVSKERFEAACLGKQPKRKITVDIDDINSWLSYNLIWPYYEIPEKNIWVMYLKYLQVALIFGDNIDNEEIDFNLTFSDWKLIKKSNLIDKKYILNIMKSCCNLDYEFYKVCNTGTWILENTRSGLNLEFSIKVSGTDYFSTTAIGFPEKLEVPMNETKINLITKFIETICNGIRDYNNQDHLGSESNS